MLKRYQIILNDWLAEHIKTAADKYDVSFSEIIRIALCMQFMQYISLRFPGSANKINEKELAKIIKKRSANKLEEEEFHRFISTLYFEARKAIENWEKREQCQKRKRNK